MNEINNSQDTLDSRDIEERIEELEDDNVIQKLDAEDSTELAILRELRAEVQDNNTEWSDGVQLIRDSYFVEYAQELAEDIGQTVSAEKWPFNNIDWSSAARELQMDYTEVSFDGIAYWV